MRRCDSERDILTYTSTRVTGGVLAAAGWLLNGPGNHNVSIGSGLGLGEEPWLFLVIDKEPDELVAGDIDQVVEDDVDDGKVLVRRQVEVVRASVGPARGLTPRAGRGVNTAGGAGG